MEELLNKIKLNNTFTAEEFESGLQFFSNSNEINSDIIDNFFAFCVKVASSIDIYDRLEKVHKVALKYYDLIMYYI